MDIKYINPFVESVSDLFESMLSSEAKMEKVIKSDPVVNRNELIGLIGLSGPIRGTVALILPDKTAFAIIGRMTGETYETVDGDMIDAIAELVNIVAGGAKARLADGSAPLTLSIPNVIRSMGSTVLTPSWATWIELNFISEFGPFKLRVTLGKDT